MKPATFHPEADTEIIEAAQYYENRSAGLGFELLDEIERALGQISTGRSGRASQNPTHVQLRAIEDTKEV